MDKSPDAFRTISEVAEVLETPAHVLRFWESRFPQIRPVKRAGGRRYYRPADVALLLGIKHLLHAEGLTIRGVQKILREQGVRHVTGLSGQEVADEADSAEDALEKALAANFGLTTTPLPRDQHEVETAQIVALESALRARVHDAPAEAAPRPEPAGAVLPLFELPAAEDLAQDPPLALPAGAPSPRLIAELQGLKREAEDDAEEALADTAPFAAVPPGDPDPDPDPGTGTGTGTGMTAATGEDARATPPLLQRLRALAPGSLATPEARALRDRLAGLVDRLQAPPAEPRP